MEENAHQIDLTNYGENVAAIMARAFESVNHNGDVVWTALYAAQKDNDGGFVGIWSNIAYAAKIFTEVEENHTEGEDKNWWLEAVEEFAFRFLTEYEQDGMLTPERLNILAESVIESAKG